MAITIGNVTTANTAQSTSLTIPVPSGGAAGDIFLVGMLHQASTFTSTNNFTVVANVTTPDTSTTGTVFSKEYAGNEGSNFLFTLSPGRKIAAVCFLLKGSTKQALFPQTYVAYSDYLINDPDFPLRVYNKYSDENYFNRTLVTFNFPHLFSDSTVTVYSVGDKHTITTVDLSPGFNLIGTSDFAAVTTDSSFVSVAYKNLNRANGADVIFQNIDPIGQLLTSTNLFRHVYNFDTAADEYLWNTSITLTFEPELTTGSRMRLFASNNTAQISNIVEISGAQNKLYANGTYVTSQFIETLG